MFVRMKINITGSRDGVPWPPPGGVLEVPDHEGDELVAQGYAEVADGPDAEAAPAEEGSSDAPGDGDDGPAEESGSDADEGRIEGGEATVPTRKRARRA